MFSYLRTKEQFLKDCGAIDNCTHGMKTFIDHAVEYRKRANPRFGVSPEEVVSWNETFNLLKRYLSDTKADFKIALEFIHQFRDKKYNKGDIGFARRTDVMIAVKERTKKRNVWKKKIYIIEFKDWKDTKTISAPADQVCAYCSLLLDNNDQVSMRPDPKGIKIQLVPVVWLYNMQKPDADDERIKKLKDCTYSKHLKLLFEGENITALWKNVPKKYDNDVFKQLRKGFPVFHLHDEVKNIWKSKLLFNDCDTWDKKDIINKNNKAGRKIQLHGDQNVCIRSLTDRIVNDGEKGLFCVIGGAGSGKSLVAILLYKYFSDNNMDVRFYIPEIAPVRAYNGPLWEMVFKLATENTDYSAGDVVIIDEAHNLFESLYSRIIDTRKGKVTIFLSDGDQIDQKNQVGTILSSKESNNYYLNSQFRCNKDDGYITFINDILNNENDFPFNADCLDFDVKVIDNLYPKLLNQCSLLINDDVATYEVDGKAFNKFTPKNDVLLNLNLKLGEFNPADLFVSNGTKNLYGTMYDVRGLDIKKSIVIIRKNDIIYKNNKVEIISPRKRSQTIQTKINKYRILLTRATETCYIYCEDKALRDYLVNEKGIKLFKG